MVTVSLLCVYAAVRLALCVYASMRLVLRRIGWDSNPRNGYPFTRSPGACLQPLGHLSPLQQR